VRTAPRLEVDAEPNATPEVAQTASQTAFPGMSDHDSAHEAFSSTHVKVRRYPYTKGLWLREKKKKPSN